MCVNDECGLTVNFKKKFVFYEISILLLLIWVFISICACSVIQMKIIKKFNTIIMCINNANKINNFIILICYFKNIKIMFDFCLNYILNKYNIN